jgi:hypothetical protein
VEGGGRGGGGAGFNLVCKKNLRERRASNGEVSFSGEDKTCVIHSAGVLSTLFQLRGAEKRAGFTFWYLSLFCKSLPRLVCPKAVGPWRSNLPNILAVNSTDRTSSTISLTPLSKGGQWALVAHSFIICNM